jgi:hypothetical protein
VLPILDLEPLDLQIDALSKSQLILAEPSILRSLGYSLEVGVTLARKHALGIFQLDDDALEAAIEASWDAIVQH